MQYAERNAPTIEHLKAWSQNIGHEHLATTVSAYGNMAPDHQGKLVRAVPGSVHSDKAAESDDVLFDRIKRLVEQRKRR